MYSVANVNPRQKNGFTLIELLVVIAIIAILATVAVTVFRGVTSAARDSKRKADIESIAKAYEAKYNMLDHTRL